MPSSAVTLDVRRSRLYSLTSYGVAHFVACNRARVVQRGARTNVGDQLMETMKQSKGDEHAER